jgi:hypothetical protein
MPHHQANEAYRILKAWLPDAIAWSTPVVSAAVDVDEMHATHDLQTTDRGRAHRALAANPGRRPAVHVAARSAVPGRADAHMYDGRAKKAFTRASSLRKLTIWSSISASSGLTTCTRRSTVKASARPG